MSAEDVVGALGTDPERGLAEEEAQERFEQFGPNELRKEGGRSLWSIIIDQFNDFLIILLIVASVISLLLGEVVDAAAIFAIVILSGALGFLQEYRAERALEALKKMAAPKALVLRDGREEYIPARELVPGDMIHVHQGDKVPADARLIKQFNLQVDEAPLTGESVPVAKEVAFFPSETAMADRRNILYAGTAITYGRGKAAVVATGMETEFGRIATMIQVAEDIVTPLEKRMAEIGKWLGVGSLAVVTVVAILGIFRGHELLEMFLWGVSLAVAAVPEALPAVVTGALAIGVRRMAGSNAIVRKLPAVETLGATTFICSDKTGTLTRGEMTVTDLWVGGVHLKLTGAGYLPIGTLQYPGGEPADPEHHPGFRLLLRGGALCTTAHVQQRDGIWEVVGDPTEGALIVAAAKVGLSKQELMQIYPLAGEISFDSGRKRMTTIHGDPRFGNNVAYVKGAADILVELCNGVLEDGQPRELTKGKREQVLQMNASLASGGLRVLGVAYRPFSELPAEITPEAIEKDLVFVGLIGMIDTARPEVRPALDDCAAAGVQVAMVTGDHKLTAMAIAKKLGMVEEYSLSLTGVELDSLDDEAFERVAERVAVYARVSPQHKMRIIGALQERGHVVAMTGDGINDAPALTQADMGVAMGITGTEVTREASDMVLADDNFATIVKAIGEGRAIYGNIKKYLAYLLSCNVGEILIMLVANLMGLPLPMTAIQLLWINLVTDGLPAIALGVDPAEPDIMSRPPRHPKESVFTLPVRFLIFGVAFLMTLGIVPVFATGLSREGLVKAQTMAFTMMTLFEMWNAFNCRSERKSIFEIGFFSNRWLVLAVGSSILLQVAVIYIPFLQGIFGTVGLSLTDWLLITAISSSALVVVEIGKWVAARRAAS